MHLLPKNNVYFSRNSKLLESFYSVKIYLYFLIAFLLCFLLSQAFAVENCLGYMGSDQTYDKISGALVSPIRNNINIICASFTLSPPVIDGRVDEKNWKRTEWQNEFWRYNYQTHRSETKTSFAVLYDTNKLYIGIQCEEPDMSAIGSEDCIEIFLDPECNRQDYYQFIANITGPSYEGFKMDKQWNCHWEAVAFQNKNSWSMEISIPLASMGRTQEKGRVWGVNICRGGRNNSVWSRTGMNHHIPGLFGFLILGYREWRQSGCKKSLQKLRTEVQNMLINTKQLDSHIASKLARANTLARKMEQDFDKTLLNNRANLELVFMQAEKVLSLFKEIRYLLSNQDLPETDKEGSGVKNGGFEEVCIDDQMINKMSAGDWVFDKTLGLPRCWLLQAGWHYPKSAKLEFRVIQKKPGTKNVYRGKRCLMLKTEAKKLTMMSSQVFQYGKQYIVTMYVRGKGAFSMVTYEYGLHEKPKSTGAGVGVTRLIDGIGVNDWWTKYKVVYKADNPKMTKGGHLWIQTEPFSTVYYDDISVKEITAPRPHVARAVKK